MKLFISPIFSDKYHYYSFYSSILILCTSIYLFYCNVSLFYLVGIVGLLSIFHHSRAYEQFSNDIFRFIDIFFANLLGIYILYLYPNEITVFLLSVIGFIYLSIQKIQSFRLKSFLHSLMHFTLCFLIFFHYLYTH
jgi:hypothetical protein